MATEAPTKPKRETWRDWMPDGSAEPERLFTRDEVVAMIEGRHVAGTSPVSAGDLRYWEGLGILPHPIRRWHDGAGRALYPSWHALFAQQVRLLQRSGYSLDEIKPRIRALARIRLGYGTADVDEAIQGNAPHPTAPEDIHLWRDLVEELERLARWRAHLTGTPTVRVEVHVIGADGRATRYQLPVAPSSDETMIESQTCG